VIWTERSIRKTILSILAEDAGKEITRRHVSALLREDLETELGKELQAATERIAEDAKANLLRKLNSIYADQTQRFNKRIAALELQLQASAPEHARRLEDFEGKLKEVVTSYRKRLDEPQRDLADMISEHKEEFAKDVKNVAANAATTMRAAARQVERQVEKLIETQLHELILGAVREHVRSTPFDQDGLSNKQLAAEKGISLRAAKRLRREGLASSSVASLSGPQSGRMGEPSGSDGSASPFSPKRRSSRISGRIPAVAKATTESR
jgi:hypothetical protein